MGIRFSSQTSQNKSAESTDGLVENNRKTKLSSESSKPRPVRSKYSHIPVTTIARIAGKRWSRMNVKERKKYIELANAEKKRRQKVKKKRLNSAEVRHSKNLRSRKKSVCKRK